MLHPAVAGASAPSRPGIVFAAPFAEEMNKARHIVAQASRRLAAAGHAVLVVDLKGCGDSSGSFDEATWTDWREDLLRAVDWMHGRGHDRVITWGLRLGAALAVLAAIDRPGLVSRCLLWQPVPQGETHLGQFLRLRIANAMLSGQKGAETGKGLRARLAAGETLEVAGYPLSPAMAVAVEQLDLAGLRPPCPVDWIEVVAEEGQDLPAGAARVADAWRQQGTELALETLVAQPFWSATNAAELVQCDAIVAATLQRVGAWP